jgi:hypothetical protein
MLFCKSNHEHFILLDVVTLGYSDRIFEKTGVVISGVDCICVCSCVCRGRVCVEEAVEEVVEEVVE